MLQHKLPASGSYTVRVRCIFPTRLSPASSVDLSSATSDRSMAIKRTVPTNLFHVSSEKLATPRTTCQTCKRLLYSFEEILLCRLCHGAYHWRCMKPETISYYGDNTHFICDKCNDSMTNTPNTSTTTSASTISPYRITNGGIKIKSPDSSETDYRDFVHAPSKLNPAPTRETSVVHAIRYFEKKQHPSSALQTNSPIKPLMQSNGYHSSSSTDPSHDDNQTIPRARQSLTGIDSDERKTPTTTAGMFQANYHYTPLKEYAATRSTRPINETPTTSNGYQHPATLDSDHQSTPRFASETRYAEFGFDPSKSRVLESSPSHPSADPLVVYSRPQHFVSTTNLNINESASRRQSLQRVNEQSNALHQSTPYLPHTGRDDSPTFRGSSRQPPTDRYSTVGSDSGIVIVNGNPRQSTSEEHQAFERKLTELVQQLGRQLESDSQKLNEKLEVKLKNLENMINQQTFIIQKQDNVIEQLKEKILHLETERDDFRAQVQLQKHDPKPAVTVVTQPSRISDAREHPIYEFDDKRHTLNDTPPERKNSSSSSVTTEPSKSSSKKTPAPRHDHRETPTSSQRNSTIGALMHSIPLNQHAVPAESSAPSSAQLLAAAVPLQEKPAAASRLDTMIHQTNPEATSHPPSNYYNVSQGHQYDRAPKSDSVYMEAGHITSSIHGENDDRLNRSAEPLDHPPKRSSSAASDSSSSASAGAGRFERSSVERTSTALRNSNKYRSLGAIPRDPPAETDQGLSPSNRAASLDFRKRSDGHDDSAIYVTPKEATHAASEYENTLRGWLRKQNRNSFFKRIERFYCVLSKNTLLMHRNENDRKAQKAVNLTNAKVTTYQDPKQGTVIELTWSNRFKDIKRYQLFASSNDEAERWARGIKASIESLGTGSAQL